MRSFVSIAMALLFTTPPALAQLSDGGPFRADVSAAAGIPQGALEDHIDGEAAGLTAFIGGPVPGLPFVLGSEIGFLNYGTDSRLSLHRTVFDDGVDERLAIPLEAVTTSVSNNILLGHLVFRLQPTEGAFRPYVDALAGLKYFATRLRVDGDVVAFRNGLSQDARVTDFAFSYGVGGGLELRLYRHRSVWSDTPTDVSLHGGLRYLFGRRADLATEGSLREVGDRLVVDEVESRTDLIVPQLGIRVSR